LTDLSTNTHPIGVTGFSWIRSSAISEPGSLAANLANVVGTTYPNATAILASLTGMDLRPYSNEILTTANNISSSVSDTITTSADSVISGISTQLGNVNSTVANSTSEYVDTVNNMADQFISMINSVSIMVLGYDNYR
jgi:hypothetical protein